jgi:hypothetical protein
MTFTIAAVGAGPPFSVRVRRFLKSALRAYGLRTVPTPRAECSPLEKQKSPPPSAAD